MIFVCYYNEEKMLYPARWKKDNCWSEQSPAKSTVSTVPFFGGHPVYVCVFSCSEKESFEMKSTKKYSTAHAFTNTHDLISSAESWTVLAIITFNR